MENENRALARVSVWCGAPETDDGNKIRFIEADFRVYQSGVVSICLCLVNIHWR